MLDPVEEHSDISFEMHEKNEVVKSKILNEFVDVSVEYCHENSYQGFFEKQFDNVQEELYLEQPSHDKQMIEFFFRLSHFYDPVEEYMEKLGRGNGWLYFHYKDQFFYYNLVPLSLSSLFFIKHEEKVSLWDRLLDWLHWKSEVT